MITSERRAAGEPARDVGGRDVFVGRRRELELIRGSLAAAAGGAGRLEIVSGAPGIGKTRLSQEVTTIARERGFYMLRGGCWEGEGAPAYWPWTEVLRHHLQSEPDIAPHVGLDFGQLLDLAATRAGVPERGVVDATKDAQQARFMLFDRFCELLAVTAAAQPMLLVIDDAQSADTGSLLLLQFLTERLPKLPIALLVTSREPLSELTASTTRHAWARHRVLRGLSRADARLLLAAGRARAPGRSTFDRLMQLTDGNPYFLKELGQLLADGSSSFDANGGVVWPASLLVVTLQPYNRLSLGCRTLLQAASVVGREFDAEVVAQAARLPVRNALALLDEAVERHVVTSLGGGRYQFAHALVREAIHDQLHPSDRTHLHESTAVALERQAKAGDPVSAATLAHHFCKGLPLTQRRQAAQYSTTAGEAAYAAFAYEEAVFQFRRAQEISGTSLSDVESCDLLLRLGAAEAGAGEWSRSRRTFEDAAALARRLNCPERFAHAALGFKGMMFGTMPVDIEAINLLEEALERLGEGFTQLRVLLYSGLSRALYFANPRDPVHHYNSLAIQLAGHVRDDRLSAELAETHLLAHWKPDTLSVLRSDAETLLALSVRTRDPLLAFRARIYRYAHWLHIGAAHDAAQDLHAAKELASATQHPRSSWQIALLGAARATARGQATAARYLSARARELGRRVHDSSPAHHDLVQAFQHARITKNYAEWLTLAAQSLERYPNTTGYVVAQAMLHAEFDQLDECRDLLRHFADRDFRTIPADNFQLFAYAIVSDAIVACEAADWARSLYSLLAPYQHTHIVAGWGTAIDGSAEHYLALLADSMGQQDLAFQHFEAALQANRCIDAPPILARTQMKFARALARRTDNELRARAHQLASAALRVYSTLQLQTLAAECNDIIARSTASSRTTRRLDDRPLTNSLTRTGDTWVIAYSGRQTTVRHLLGFRYLEQILLAAGDPIHVLDLLSDPAPQRRALTTDTSLSADAEARHAYKQRLKELTREIEEATEDNDIGRLERLDHERQQLLEEVAYSFGLRGQGRPLRSATERARISVKNRISAALKVLKEYHPEAYNHLSRSIITGMYCRYSPLTPTQWTLRQELHA